MRFGTATRLSLIAAVTAAWPAGPSGADGGTAVASCDARDQLECSCKGTSYPNKTVVACFEATPSVLTRNQADELAANAFAAISWPGSGLRGVADPAAMLAQGPVPEDHAPVWEGWRSTSDIFRNDGSAPLPWDAKDQVVPDACEGVTLTQELQAAYSWAEVPQSPYPPRVLQQMVNPQDQVLVDRSGQPVRYEVAFNWQAWNYVVQDALWTIPGLRTATKGGNLSFPAGNRTPETRGAMVVKAAWKILDPALDDPRHFHKAWAYVTPVVKAGKAQAGCEIRPVGLVGLHVTMKLKQGWLWGTVEHRALAPLQEPQESQLPSRPPIYAPGGEKAKDGTGGWLFYERPGCSGLLCAGQSALNVAPEVPGNTDLPIFPPAPNRITIRDAPGSYYPADSNASSSCGEFTAYQEGEPDTEASISFGCINTRLWAGFKGNALEFYQLKGSQWNRDGEPVPSLLANAAIESFNQDSSSCQSCHQGAGQPPAKALSSVPPGPPLFDHVFAFMHIPGMSADGTLP